MGICKLARKKQFTVNVSVIDKNNFNTLQLNLTFDISNKMCINGMVGSGASSNVIPYSLCQKLNVEPKKCDTHIVQID